MTPLQGRHVVVTGASRGIGRAIAVAVAEAGGRVTAVARSTAELEEAVAALPGEGHRASAFDVSDAAAWERLAEHLHDADGLVAAAAVMGPIGRVDTVDLAGFREAFEINVLGTVLAVRACLPGLALSGGSVVTFSGGGGGALPRYDAYASSKAAVVRLTENLSADLQDVGVRVNAVAPGFVATEIHRATLEAGADAAGADYHRRTLEGLAQGGVPASAAAELTVFLLSSSSAPLSGRVLSAQWDPWREQAWRSHVAADAALLTMRRIDDELFTAVDRTS